MRVPGYEGGVKSSALPGVRVNTSAPIEAFGGGATAQGLTNATNQAIEAGKEFAQVVQKEKEKADDTVTQDAYSDFQRKINDLKYNPDTGAYRRQGKDALGIGEQYGEQFYKYADELEGGLHNDDQRALFYRMRQKLRVDFDRDMLAHEGKEGIEYRKTSLKSSIATAQETAALESQDPERRNWNLGMIKSRTMELADELGVDSDSANLLVLEETSKAHDGIIDAMLSKPNGYLEAKAYYAQNKNEVSEKYRDRIEKALEEGGVRGESQKLSDGIMSRRLSMTQSIQAAKKEIEDPKLQDATIERIEKDFSLRDKAKREAQEAITLRATNIIENGFSWDDIPISDRSVMTPGQRSSIREYERSLRKGVEPEPNGPVFYDMKTLAGNPETREAFLKEDLSLLKGKVTNGELRSLIDAQAGLRKGDGKAGAKLDGFMTDTQLVDGILVQIGEKNPKSKRAQLFKTKLDQAVAQHEKKTGHEVTNDELRVLANDLAVTVVTDKGYLWDSRKRAFELEDPSAQIEDVEYDRIPKPRRDQIEGYLKQNGYKVTPESVEKVYMAQLGGKPGGQ